MLPLRLNSRIGNSSALVVAAALALARETGRRHLLDIASTDSGDRQDSYDRENYADPPVPNVCCEHEFMVATLQGDLLVTRPQDWN